MSTISHMTAEQLYSMPHNDIRYELVLGELRMMSPSGWKHGEVVGILHTLLGSFVRPRKLGKVFGAETGFKITENPDTVRAPDIAFITAANLPDKSPQEGYWPGAPDLAVEVLSPSDRPDDVSAKTQMWLSSGVQQVWNVDLANKLLSVHHSSGTVDQFSANQHFEPHEIVQGFSMDLNELFESFE